MIITQNSLTCYSQQTRQVAEMTKRSKPVTNQTLFSSPWMALYMFTTVRSFFSSLPFLNMTPRYHAHALDLGYSDQLSFANQNARAFARSYSNRASYRQASSCILIHAKICNVFLERCPQIASVFATEVGDVVSLSRHSGTRSQCAGILGRQGMCWNLPLPLCAIAAHSVPTTASNNVDSVVNGNVQVHVATQMKVCKMEELDESSVWREAAAQGSIQNITRGPQKRVWDETHALSAVTPRMIHTAQLTFSQSNWLNSKTRPRSILNPRAS